MSNPFDTDELIRTDKKPRLRAIVNNDAVDPIGLLGEIDAGDVVGTPPPRQWLLGNMFARTFMSSLLADGGVGKTALRVAQLMSLAIVCSSGAGF
jgi:hypothetical protein